jgi:hypothetical protein
MKRNSKEDGPRLREQVQNLRGWRNNESSEKKSPIAPVGSQRPTLWWLINVNTCRKLLQ